MRAIGRRPRPFIAEPGRVLDARQAAALKVNVFVGAAERVVRLPRQAGATAFGTQLETLVIAAEDGREDVRGPDCAGQIRPPRVDVRSGRARAEDGIIVVHGRRKMTGGRRDIRRAQAEPGADFLLDCHVPLVAHRPHEVE